MSNTIDIYSTPEYRKVEAVVQLMVDGRLTSYRTRREKRLVWNGTCLDGSLDRCDHRFCCEHVLEKFWNGLYLEYYLCLPLCRIDSLG